MHALPASRDRAAGLWVSVRFPSGEAMRGNGFRPASACVGALEVGWPNPLRLGDETASAGLSRSVPVMHSADCVRVGRLHRCCRTASDQCCIMALNDSSS